MAKIENLLNPLTLRILPAIQNKNRTFAYIPFSAEVILYSSVEKPAHCAIN